MKKKISYDKAAFTLVEVLIALAIIGVVAALTIPGVIRDYQKKQTIASLRKAYTTIDSVIRMAKAEDRVSDIADTRFIEELQSYRAEQTLKKYFANAKIQNTGKTDLKNYYNFTTTSNHSYSLDPYNVIYRIDLPHATYFLGTVSDYASYQGRMMANGPAVIVAAFVDTNGIKTKPNRAGRDLFAFKFATNQTYNTNFAVLNPSSHLSHDPFNFFNKVLNDNWEIKYW